MSLADSLAREASTSKGPRCSICQLVDNLEPSDQDTLLAAFADARFTGAAITRALRSEGHSVSAQMITRHRKGECVRR